MWYCEHPFNDGHHVLVLRHAERPQIPTGDFGNELSLTKEGEQASEALGKRLGNIPWGEIHTSPLVRCEQTAFHFLKGTQQKTPIIKSQILGDPGPFVYNPQKAGPHFLEKPLNKITHDAPIPGMRTVEEGGLLFVNYLKTIQLFPCLMISHDIIIALLVSYFSKIETSFPNFLDGFCLKIEPDNLTLFIENQKPFVMAL